MIVVADHIHKADRIQETLSKTSDTTLAVLGENRSEEGYRVPSPEDGDSEQEGIEEESANRLRYESDSMLAQAYRELSEASRDMATWSHATSVSCPKHVFFRAGLRILWASAMYSKNSAFDGPFVRLHMLI